MKSILALLALVITSLVSGCAVRQGGTVLQGDELRRLVVTQRGTTWTMADGKQFSFLPKGRLYVCGVPKVGKTNCEYGRYSLTDKTVEVKFDSGITQQSQIKRDGFRLSFGHSEVAQYSASPTLRPLGDLTPAEAILETRPVSYHEISGYWTQPSEGWLSDFSLKNVKISGESFSADFFLKSAGQLACSIDRKIQGTYVDRVFKFDLHGHQCFKTWFHRATLDMGTLNGFYFVGSVKGLYTVQAVVLGPSQKP